MIYIEAPTEGLPKSLLLGTLKSVFMAGGITGCPDWQRGMGQALSHTKAVVFNPRRADFPIDDPNASFEQIRWEFLFLRRADAILFWFPKDTLCPIVLFELGAWSMRQDKLIFVGVEPGYQREQDVRIQLSFVRPEVEVQNSMLGLANQVLAWLDSPHPVLPEPSDGESFEGR